MNYEWIGGVAGLGALVLAAITLKRQTDRDRRVESLQIRVTAIEEARRAEELEARVQADITVVARRTRNPLVLDFELTNSGPAQATDVFMTVGWQSTDGEEIFKMPPQFPPSGIERLHPGQTYKVTAEIEEARPSLLLALSWKDGSGSRAKRMHVTPE